jgi:hypothetical protein
MMSDMFSDRIAVRFSTSLGNRLRARCRASGKAPSTIVRLALEAYLGANRSSKSAFEAAVAAGVIGCTSGLPKNLSANRPRFEGFGKQDWREQ